MCTPSWSEKKIAVSILFSDMTRLVNQRNTDTCDHELLMINMLAIVFEHIHDQT